MPSHIYSGPGGERLDKWLAETGGFSRGDARRLIEEGRVLVGGVVATKPSQKMKPGMEVTWEEPAPKLTTAVPTEMDLDILYVDEHIVVINKRAGLVVHPAAGHEDDTLVNGLVAMGLLRTEHGDLRPGIVHRLDKDTSGVMVVALTPKAREGLIPQFAEHTIERRYVAIVAGSPPDSGVFDTLHGRNPRNRLKFTTRVRQGRRAITEYEVLERFGKLASMVRATLRTGRTHQIRVHFSEAGFPLIGDPLYKSGGLPKEVAALWDLIPRQALHAQVLGFTHPVTGEWMRFESDPPEDMMELVRRLKELT